MTHRSTAVASRPIKLAVVAIIQDVAGYEAAGGYNSGTYELAEAINCDDLHVGLVQNDDSVQIL